MPTGKSNPPFLSAPVMRRALRARLLSVDPLATDVLKVKVVRLGGFEDRSHKIRYTVTLVRANGQRVILRLRGTNEWLDDSRRQAYEIMKFLWRHGFATGAYRIARPITYFRRWRLLLYEEAAGAPVSGLIRRCPRAGDRLVKEAAMWLARLHCYSPRSIRLVYNQAGRKRYWLRALDILADLTGPEAAAMSRSIRRVMRYEDQLARGRHRVLVHHDFHLGNLLSSPAAITAVDFTESRLSHPLVDVATFHAQLEFQAAKSVSIERISRWQSLFLRTYRQRAPGLNLDSAAACRMFRFIRFRIALQTYLGEHLFGRRHGRFHQLILNTTW